MNRATSHLTTWEGVLFQDAFRLWLDSRVSISKATRHGYKKNYLRLAPHFAAQPMGAITYADLDSYRQLRLTQCGPNSINKELNMLSQIMRKAGLWEPIARWYERLPQPKSEIGIALEPEEEAHLFQTAAQNPRWAVVFCAALLCRNAALCPNELRQLTLGNIDRQNFAWVRIKRGFKNGFRKRTNPCNVDAAFALQILYERARKKGCRLDTDYLLFGRGPHPDRPMCSWYSAWHSLRAEAGKLFPRLRTMRFYDNRHTFCTRMLENPMIPYNAIEAMMGHRIASDTKRFYDHVRDASLRHAADSIASGHPELRRKPPQPARPNETGFSGVSQHEKRPGGPTYYRARITVNGRRVHLGDFPTAEEAAKVHDQAAALIPKLLELPDHVPPRRLRALA